MGRSIENIWKDGFMKEPIRPEKIVAFYNRKSVHLVNNVVRRMKFEVMMIIPLGILVLVLNLIIGKIGNVGNAWVLIGWSLLSVLPLLPFYFFGRKHIQKLESLDFGQDCYQYLNVVKTLLLKTIQFNKKMVLLILPMIIFLSLLFTYFKQQGKTIGEIFGVSLDWPGYTLFLILPITIVLSYFVAELLFGKEMSRVRNRFDTLLHDMDLLRTIGD